MKLRRFFVVGFCCFFLAAAANPPLTPEHSISKTKIIVWRFFPHTPSNITTDNPTCPAGDGIPPSIKIGKSFEVGSNMATCNPLSAAELVPSNQKIVDTHYYAAEGNHLKQTDFLNPSKECIISTLSCPIQYSRWEQVAPGYGHFKNWSGDRDRTAAVVVTLAAK